MHRPRPFHAALVVVAVTACGGDGDAPSSGGARLVVGVTADAPLRGALDHVVLRAHDASGWATAWQDDYDGHGALQWPLEGLGADTMLTIELEAYGAGDDTPWITRSATLWPTEARRPLLHLRLNDECRGAAGEPAVSCPGATCIAGLCALPRIDVATLRDFDPTWPEPPSSGVCGDVDVREPGVTIGLAGDTFTPLVDGDTVVPQRGHQGASHFMLSVRIVDAAPEGAVTHHFGTLLGAAWERSPVELHHPYATHDGHCTLESVPFVLPPTEFAGDTLRLGVTVRDATGNAGRHQVDVRLTAPQPFP